MKIVYDGRHVEHWMNGVKYFEFEIGSDDFQRRVKNSKFAVMPRFAANKTGYIALQGDHGAVSFANIKVRPLPAKPRASHAVKLQVHSPVNDEFAAGADDRVPLAGAGCVDEKLWGHVREPNSVA